ncbi:uncharacterized protein LOC121768611 [Salvia splendens]|nr:uncharacterized protein LOC121768611 [Salvia splendens]
MDEKTIALRCEANNKYCSRNRFYYDYLHAAADTIVNEARFEVKERVSSRKIYDVKYQLDEARIYNKEPFIAGSAMLTNKSNDKATLTSAITYEEQSTSTFTSTWSLTGGVKVSFEGNLCEAVKGKVEVSVEVKKEWSWSEETETKKSSTVNASADVPANTSIKISYIGTKGSYSVPFSYSQEDVDSATGEHTVTQHYDGIYYGSNYYNMDFEVAKPIPL